LERKSNGSDVAVRLTGHEGAVTSVAASPTGQLLASASEDHTVRLWLFDDESLAERPGENRVFKAHTNAVRSVDFSSDGQALVTASDDMSIKVWHVPKQRVVATFCGSGTYSDGHSAEVSCAKINKDNSLIASGGVVPDETVKIWDLQQGKCISTFFHHELTVNSVAWLASGMLISGSDDKTVKLWDLRAKKLVLQFVDAHTKPVLDVAFHPNGRHIASSSEDSSVRIWDLRRSDLAYSLTAHEAPTPAVAFSPEGDLFASGSADDQVLLWKSNFDHAKGAPPPLAEAPEVEQLWNVNSPVKTTHCTISPSRNTVSAQSVAREGAVDMEETRDLDERYAGRNWDA
jgi:centriolar protein POC1